LAEVTKVSPFEIQFADTSGLCAIFLKEVTAAQARKISGLILDIAPESGDWAAHDLEQAGLPVPQLADYPDEPDPEAATLECVHRLGKFRLWWD
jgi:hypothetical protein